MTSYTVLRGDEAEIRLQERVPDLLILDWMLPGTLRHRTVPAAARPPRNRAVADHHLLNGAWRGKRARPWSCDRRRRLCRQAVLHARTAGTGRAMLRRARPEVISSLPSRSGSDTLRARPRKPTGVRHFGPPGRDVKLGPTGFRLARISDEFAKAASIRGRNCSMGRRVFVGLSRFSGVHDVYVDETHRRPSMSAGCARPSTSRACATSSAPCAAPAISIES